MNLRPYVLALFVLSGAAGLVYEIVWARQLVLVFGNTTQAISAILTGYFGGLAIGSLVGGRIADRSRRPLRLYGLLEILLVAVVLVTPVLFRLLHEAYRAGFETLAGTPALVVVKFALAIAVLAPATILMGATLPTLSRYLARRQSELGVAFGLLYTANTFGAVVGAAVAGFVLIELFGLSLAIVVGAACSATAGVVALVLDRSVQSPQATDSTPADVAATDAGGLARSLVLAAAFVSGLTSLGYQILWTRLLSSGTGNSTYVFTFILTAFLLGIAIGAPLITSRALSGERAARALGVVQLGIGALAVVGTVLIGGRIVDLSVVDKILIVVLPTSVVIGLSLPLASALIGSGDARVGSDAGLLLAANTSGVILGTLAVPFVLIPTIGSPIAIVMLAILNLIVGGLLLGRPHRAPARWLIRSPGVAGLGIVLSIALATSGLAADPAITSVRRAGSLLEATEDEIASVQAGVVAGQPQLWVTGTSMTVLTVDARLMAVLPTMLRPDATKLLVIAFGMGSSYRSGLILGHEVDGVELVPSVPEMFHHYFDDAGAVLANPRGRIVIADGRNHVELTSRTYDIVVVDPPPPIISSGTSVLYSREFYAASARRLTPGGLMMQWIPFGQTLDDFRAHVRTFRGVFPHVLIAFGPGDFGVFMLGSADLLMFNDAAVREVLGRPGVLEDLSSAVDTPASSVDEWAALIPELVWVDGDEVDRFAGTGPLITDDRPLPEYFLIRTLTAPASPWMSRASLEQAAG